jgi:hypothetical protein
MHVIPSRADGEGPPSRGSRHTKRIALDPTITFPIFAQACDRLRDPSARCASLGMTRGLLNGALTLKFA